MRLAWRGSSGTLAAVLLAAVLGSVAGAAQAPNLITRTVDVSRLQALANHHPLWAIAANDAGALPAAQAVEGLTLVLNRTAEQEAALEAFLAEQQDPASANYHHWLTPQEVGEQFGPSDADVSALTGWLQSQGLHVDFVSPSKVFIGFGGAAADVNRALQTTMHTYMVNGKRRVSVSSNPLIPAAVAPAIKAIHGLYTVDMQPQSRAEVVESVSPEMSSSSGAHYVSPGDFANIYDLPSGSTGAGVTIAVVGRSRVNPADLNNFKSLTGTNFTNPTEIVPVAYGGKDPGPAATAPPSSGPVNLEQLEATLDVTRAGSIAYGANLILMVTTAAGGDIDADAQYLVNTSPVPAQVMTISYGECEAQAGFAAVRFWDTLFQQGALEGVSSFVSSGDSGASGCDNSFSTPPSPALALSPNFLCSSSYVTCVGGTEFNDTADPSGSWATSNSSLTTALWYIPEGGWNESWDGTTESVAASGGGVSSYIPTPSWQKGTPGVPAGNVGRYTPDVSFTSAGHDAYFGCFAAGGAGNCVVSGGSFHFVALYGTSAAAPSMAGIAALLDQKSGGGQGNLNPGLYQMYVGAPPAFHDVTVAWSGVANCDVTIPSMCNNSIPASNSSTSPVPGYLVGTGYDEVTGLGSLDVAKFVNYYSVASKIMTPAVTLSMQATINTLDPIAVGAQVDKIYAGGPTPTGSVQFTIGSSGAMVRAISGGYATLMLAAGSLPIGIYSVTAVYLPDSASAKVYSSVTVTGQLTITAPAQVTPVISLSPSSTTITNSQAVTVPVTVSTPSWVLNYPAATGTITLASGSYSSGPVSLVGGVATVTIPAGSLAVGSDTVTATYLPDSAGASFYLSASNSMLIQNQGAKITPSVFVGANGVTTAQPVSVGVTVSGFQGNATPTGTVVVTCGSFSSGAVTLVGGMANITIAAGSLPPGLNTLTGTYTPDAQSSALYNSATVSNTVGITLATQITPAVTVTPASPNPTTAEPLFLTITLSGRAGYPTPSGTVVVNSSATGILSGGVSTVSFPAGSFFGGSDGFTIVYYPDQAASYIYGPVTFLTYVSVAKTTPTITVVPSSSNLLTTDSFNVTVNATAAGGAPQIGDSATLTGGSFTTQLVFIQGVVSTSFPAGRLMPGTNTISVSYAGNQYYNAATGTSSVTVAMPANAGVSITTTNVSLSKGATSGNASSITMTPTNGFVGTVNVSAVITSSPAGAQNPPVLSLAGSSAIPLVGFQPVTTQLTIGTAVSTAGTQGIPGRPWYVAGGTALACLLCFLAPVGRRRWLSGLGMLVLVVAFAAGAGACGGGSVSGGGSGGSTGTTSGNYVITVTATSGAITASNTITLTVQ